MKTKAQSFAFLSGEADPVTDPLDNPFDRRWFAVPSTPILPNNPNRTGHGEKLIRKVPGGTITFHRMR